MRVLLAGAATGVLPARAALSALAAGWREGDPGADLQQVLCSDGSRDLLDAVEAARGGRRLVASGLTADRFREVPALVLLSGGTAYIQAADVLGSVSAQATEDLGGRDAEAAAAVAAATSYGVGQLVAAAVGAGARRVVIGAGDAPVLDLGTGFLAALAGRDVPSPGATVAGAQLAELAGAAEHALTGVELVVAAATDTTARGLRGAASVLADLVGAQPAAELDGAAAAPERTLSDLAARRRRDLLAPPTAGARRQGGVRAGASPGSGAGGGLGLAVLAVGGRVAPGPALVALETGLAANGQDVDLVVCLSDRLDPLEADRGVLGAVSALGRGQGTAVLALGATGSLDRRAGAPHGVSAAATIPGVSGSGEAQAQEAIRAAGAKQARAWSW